MVLYHGVVHGVSGIHKVERITVCDSQDGSVVAAGNVVKVQTGVDSSIVDLENEQNVSFSVVLSDAEQLTTQDAIWSSVVVNLRGPSEGGPG